MDSNEFDVRRTVVSVLEQCSNCNQHYSPDDVRVIERQGELWVLVVRCSHCDAQAYVAAVVDPEKTEINRATKSHAVSDAGIYATISVDDVLDLHEFLEEFDGDFAALFNRHRR